MRDSLQKEIGEENHREALRAQRLNARDWSLVLGAAVVFAALLGFIYLAEDTGIDQANVEPAAGSVLSYDTDEIPAPAAPAPVPGQSTTAP
jgi:hypothetical protein